MKVVVAVALMIHFVFSMHCLPMYTFIVCSFVLILDVPVIVVQSCWDDLLSCWVEPVLSSR